MTHAATVTMNTKKASGTATLDGENFSCANPAGIRNRMIIARATAPIATNISRKISSRHPARNPLGPVITAGRPIVLLSIIVSFLSALTEQTGCIPRRSYYAKVCRKISLAVARWYYRGSWTHGHIDFFLSKNGAEGINSLCSEAMAHFNAVLTDLRLSRYQREETLRLPRHSRHHPRDAGAESGPECSLSGKVVRQPTLPPARERPELTVFVPIPKDL